MRTKNDVQTVESANEVNNNSKFEAMNAENEKVATSNAAESENTTEVASAELQSVNNMEEKELLVSGNVAIGAASVEQVSKATSKGESDCGCPPDENDTNVKPVKGDYPMENRTTVKGIIDGEVKEFIVAHTEYGMRHDKKMDKMLNMANRTKLLTPRYHFCKPEIFWKEGYNLFDNNGELIEQGTANVLAHCETPETSERILIDDFLEDVEIHDFESVAEYAQHIGETALISRMPSKVEEMGIGAMATGEKAVKEAYEFAIDNGMSYTTALGYLDGEMKPITLKLMMRGIKPKLSLTLGRTKEQAQILYGESSNSLGKAESLKRYVPRALNIILKKEKFSFDMVIEALRTIPASDVTMAKLADCGGKEACIAGALISWILTLQRQKETKAAA